MFLRPCFLKLTSVPLGFKFVTINNNKNIVEDGVKWGEKGEAK